ncbi:M20/M25/M40 family metallo-hydrolase [Solihabitans fulvus]|uniref:M20/M25/M40 family metallo-hydrolase n=1 Tax=Solihabitans fulvus TaxID=1892852 RepID=A0A5B2XDJ3_9PSEU|nr:M20/M25/M40 family metallo-hydrolase [Solihabitans fulvus]KAA2261109.1 M20/M25/M40 family metallo-hydrolase [Solihabitans fulvus]
MTPRSTRRTFLTATTALGAAVIAGGAVPAGAAELGDRGPGGPVRPQQPDQELRAILRELDERRIEAIVRQLASFGTRHTASSQTDPNRGIGAARDWLFGQFQQIAATSGGRMTVELQTYVQPPADRIPVPTTITNVVATLRGATDPTRVYVVSGHYDSRCTDVLDFTSDAPGADDDATGVAVAMELARLFATRPPAATVVFTAVAGEEQGLYGSRFQSKQYKAAGTDVQAMFTNDIIGASRADDGTHDPFAIRLFAEGVPTAETPAEASLRRSIGGENDSPPRQLARFVRSVAANEATGMDVRIVYRRDRYLRGGDHIGYLEQGYPAARFTEPHENYAHQHQNVRVENGLQFGDLPEFCDFAFTARVGRVNAAALWSLASAPGTPKGAQLRTAVLANDSDLLWDAVPGAVGYEVLWRETTAPDWTHVIDVGTALAAKVNLSKDNVFFGVRAVGPNGHRSPVAFPSPTN